MINHKAIHALYPSVVLVRDEAAFDADGQEVKYDIAAVNAWVDVEAYKINRVAEYPPITDYLDAIVKGDQAQIDKYIADCQAVKAKYPKP